MATRERHGAEEADYDDDGGVPSETLVSHELQHGKAKLEKLVINYRLSLHSGGELSDRYREMSSMLLDRQHDPLVFVSEAYKYEEPR